jgi:hypothetical protein
VSTVVAEEAAGEVDSVFPHDYCYSYKNVNPWSKYFLPLLATKLVLTAFLAVLLETYPFVLLAVCSVLSGLFLVYLLIVRPFQSVFTNFRIIALEFMLTVLNGIYCIYQYFASKNEYVGWLEKCVAVGVAVVLGAALLFGLVEHYRAWIYKVWELCDDCCLYFRLMGGSKKVFDAEESKR